MGCINSKINTADEIESHIDRRSAIKNVENSITLSVSLFRGKRNRDDIIMSDSTKIILEVALRGFFALDGSDDALYDNIGNEMKCEVCEDNKMIIAEGDSGDTLYFLEKGSLIVLKGSEVFHTVEPGKIFGELAVISSNI